MTTLTAGEARRAARNAGAIALARILSSGAQFLWQIILAGSLGQAEFGVYGAVGALFNIGVTVASFSIGLIVIREVARRPEESGRIWGAALFIQTTASLLAYVGINIAATGYDDVIRGYAAVACLSVFVDTIGSHCYDQLLARERMVTTSVIEVAHIAVRLALAAGALSLGFGLMGVYLATLVASVGRSALLWVLLWRTGARPVFPVDRRILRVLILDSAPLTVYAFINMTYSQIDKLLTSGLLTNADTGYLTAGFVIVSGAIEILSTTVLVAIYPMLSRMGEEGAGQGSDAFRFVVEKLAFFTLLIGVPMGLVFSVFAPALIVPLFGSNYAPTAEILRVLIWFASVTMISNVFAQALFAQNRQRRMVVYRVIGLACKLAISLILLPRIGVIGAALSSVTAELVVLAILTRDFRIGWRALVPRLGRLAALAGVTALAFVGFGAVHVVVGLMAGGIVYAGGVLIGRILAPDDWDLLYRLTAAMPGGAVILRWWKRETVIGW